MPDLVDKYLDLLSSQHRNLIEKILRIRDQVRDDLTVEQLISEVRVLLETIKKLSARDPFFTFTAHGGRLDSGLFNSQQNNIFVDFHHIFQEADIISEAIGKHSSLDKAVLRDLRLSLKKATEQVDRYIRINNDFDGYSDIFFDTFQDSLTIENFSNTKKNFFKDHISNQFLLPASYDSNDQTIKMDSTLIIDRLLTGKSPIIRKRKQLGSGLSRSVGKSHHISKSIDDSITSFWGEVILSESPFFVPVQIGDRLTISNGAVCIFEIIFPDEIRFNEILFSPYTFYPMDIVRIFYSGSADVYVDDNSAFNKITEIPGINPINQSDRNYIASITDPITFNFPVISARKIVFVVNQRHYRKVSYNILESQSKNTELWEKISERSLESIKNPDIFRGDSFVNNPINQDFVDDVTGWTEYVKSQLNLVKQLRFSSRDITGGLTNDSEKSLASNIYEEIEILRKSKKSIVISKYEYIYGAYDIKVREKIYRPSNVLVMKPIFPNGDVKNVFLQPNVRGLVTNPVLLEGKTFETGNKVRFYFTTFRNPANNHWIELPPNIDVSIPDQVSNLKQEFVVEYTDELGNPGDKFSTTDSYGRIKCRNWPSVNYSKIFQDNDPSDGVNDFAVPFTMKDSTMESPTAGLYDPNFNIDEMGYVPIEVNLITPEGGIILQDQFGEPFATSPETVWEVLMERALDLTETRSITGREDTETVKAMGFERRIDISGSIKNTRFQLANKSWQPEPRPMIFKKALTDEGSPIFPGDIDFENGKVFIDDVRPLFVKARYRVLDKTKPPIKIRREFMGKITKDKRFIFPLVLGNVDKQKYIDGSLLAFVGDPTKPGSFDIPPEKVSVTAMTGPERADYAKDATVFRLEITVPEDINNQVIKAGSTLAEKKIWITYNTSFAFSSYFEPSLSGAENPIPQPDEYTFLSARPPLIGYRALAIMSSVSERIYSYGPYATGIVRFTLGASNLKGDYVLKALWEHFPKSLVENEIFRVKEDIIVSSDSNFTFRIEVANDKKYLWVQVKTKPVDAISYLADVIIPAGEVYTAPDVVNMVFKLEIHDIRKSEPHFYNTSSSLLSLDENIVPFTPKFHMVNQENDVEETGRTFLSNPITIGQSTLVVDNISGIVPGEVWIEVLDPETTNNEVGHGGRKNVMNIDGTTLTISESFYNDYASNSTVVLHRMSQNMSIEIFAKKESLSNKVPFTELVEQRPYQASNLDEGKKYIDFDFATNTFYLKSDDFTVSTDIYITYMAYRQKIFEEMLDQEASGIYVSPQETKNWDVTFIPEIIIGVPVDINDYIVDYSGGLIQFNKPTEETIYVSYYWKGSKRYNDQKVPYTKNITNYITSEQSFLKKFNSNQRDVDYYPVIEYIQKGNEIIFAQPIGTGNLPYKILVKYKTLENGIRLKAVFENIDRWQTPILEDITLKFKAVF